ncbi:reverse transcriptase [Canna indica]|uniref:Reverse transcriptase n=1 Tax=Canna indica TaxID=4628 RepID=A0AAQ3QFA2_9LILI|nr:reverse transcriptase [Canna indica]
MGEIKEVIDGLKNHKAPGPDGILNELFKSIWNKEIVKQIYEGGLGLLNLNSHNQAILGGWIWKLRQNKEKQWVDILKAIFTDFDHLCASRGRLSHVWRGVIRGLDFFNSSLSFQVGEGTIEPEAYAPIIFELADFPFANGLGNILVF